MPTTVALVLVLAAACPAVAVAASALVRSQRVDRIEIAGVGCGVAGSASVPLPATATDVRVLEPRVGATTDSSRLTEVAVEVASVRLTAVGEGEDVCDPEADEVLPPDQRRWFGRYDYDVSFRERVSVRYWAGADVTRGRPVSRPRSVTMPDAAAAVRIRWRTFGGRRAIGFGRLRGLTPNVKCTPRACPGHGARFKVVLSRPSRCADIGDAVYYGRVAFIARERARFIRRGELYLAHEPNCRTGARRV